MQTVIEYEETSPHCPAQPALESPHLIQGPGSCYSSAQDICPGYFIGVALPALLLLLAHPLMYSVWQRLVGWGLPSAPWSSLMWHYRVLSSKVGLSVKHRVSEDARCLRRVGFVLSFLKSACFHLQLSA